MYFSEMFKRIRKSVAVPVAIAMALALPATSYAADITPAAAPSVPVADPVDVFLSQSAFIGNSVGEGLTMYNNAKGKVPLGNATMLTRVSYSFYADANGMTKYLPRLNGVPMRAKDAIRQSGALYVFISMGTNDLVGSSTPEKAYANYQQYLAGIMAENPFVTIFIESCTPTRPGSNVNNDKVTRFNAYMQSYCDSCPNMFYVDIATPLKDASGNLAANLSSDGSVHLTNKAYEIWANTVRAYISNFLVARLAAMREKQESDILAVKADRDDAIRKMHEKQQEKRNERLVAEQKARDEEEARRREEMLTVPDGATLLKRVLAKENDRDDDLPVGNKDILFAGLTGR